MATTYFDSQNRLKLTCQDSQSCFGVDIKHLDCPLPRASAEQTTVMSEAATEASLLELIKTLVDLERRHIDELDLVVAGGGQDVGVTGADVHCPDGSILLDRVVIA